MDMLKLSSILSNDETIHLLNGFFHSCINEICGYRGPSYKQFIEIGWTEKEYKHMHIVIRGMFTNPTVLYLDETKMPQEFLDMPDGIQSQILSCLREKQELLVNTLVRKYSQKHMKTMIDFDWRLKMIMGSSKVSSLREPLVQLDLTVVEHETESILDLEMDKNELDSFIKILESAI